MYERTTSCLYKALRQGGKSTEVSASVGAVRGQVGRKHPEWRLPLGTWASRLSAHSSVAPKELTPDALTSLSLHPGILCPKACRQFSTSTIYFLFFSSRCQSLQPIHQQGKRTIILSSLRLPNLKGPGKYFREIFQRKPEC